MMKMSKASNEPVLVVLAAGIGSRYGGGIKQLAKVGPCGEIILEYSIFDAIRAGFKKVIFIIRKDIEADFKEIIGDKISDRIKVAYAFQNADDLPEGFCRPDGRKKPWGTGHAVLACREMIDGPFAVINADDFYGSEAFEKMYKALEGGLEPGHCFMVGFVLKNTLSDNGTVTRGVCHVSENGTLTGVDETGGIICGSDGIIRGNFNGSEQILDKESLVSMNFWGFGPDFMDELNKGFPAFLSGLDPDDLKSEYLLPGMVDTLIKAEKTEVEVLSSGDKWFGITYQEDRPEVENKLRLLAKEGRYPSPLF